MPQSFSKAKCKCASEGGMEREWIKEDRKKMKAFGGRGMCGLRRLVVVVGGRALRDHSRKRGARVRGTVSVQRWTRASRRGAVVHGRELEGVSEGRLWQCEELGSASERAAAREGWVQEGGECGVEGRAGPGADVRIRDAWCVRVEYLRALVLGH